MKINVLNQNITDFHGDVVIVNLFQNTKALSGATRSIDKKLGGLITKLIADREITGKLGETAVLHTSGKLRAAKVIVVGLGKKDDLDYDTVRKAAAAAAKRARDIRAKNVGTLVHGAGHLDPVRGAQSLVEGIVLSLYTFATYKKPENDHQIGTFSIVEKEKRLVAKLGKGAVLGKILAESQNIARDLTNEPANQLTPEKLLLRINKIIRNKKLEKSIRCECLGKKVLERMGMGALLSVAQGSSHEAKFIVLRLKKTNGLPVCLIGKTVTFDSGGISIKPSAGMGEMKGDMAGGAAAIGTTLALAQTGCKVNLVTLIPAVENMPSGTAARPGDIVRALNGKTIEIISTDAEGRMTLADAIVYGEKQGAQVIVDIATLTGACIVALGESIAGVMGNDQALIDKLIQISKDTGESCWQLPLYESYNKLIESTVADVKNSGGRNASTITAGLFLRAFVDKAKWLHIDIAGKELTEKASFYTPVGGTGFGVRTLYEFISKL